jgi:Arc/MetJ family transcription regulator
MTTVQITLPDQLAQEAEQAGLLSSESLEELLRRQLKAKATEQLFAAMDKMSAEETVPYMSPEEVAEEIKAMGLKSARAAALDAKSA